MPRPKKRRRRGTGSIFHRKSDGRWVATISRGSRGERQVRASYHRTRAEAEAALAELRARHGPLKASSLTVGAYLERWVRDARDLRPRTRVNYESVVRVHLTPALGMYRMADLSPLHVEAMLARLMPLMAPKTLRNIPLILRRALGQAVRAELIDRNPAAREYVDAPRVIAPEPDALTVAQIARVRPLLPGHPLEAHVIVALGTGLRQGEQLGLAWEDVDLPGGRLTVRKALAYISGKYERVEPKTARSRRVVRLAPGVVEALTRHKEALKAAGFMPIETGPVFINTKGTALSGSWLTHAWYRLLDDAGVGRKPWKVLRATFASRLFAEGVPDRAIADLLGHARTATTHGHYVSTGAASNDVEEAIGRLVG